MISSSNEIKEYLVPNLKKKKNGLTLKGGPWVWLQQALGLASATPCLR
jgi:hypothetical protein